MDLAVFGCIFVQLNRIKRIKTMILSFAVKNFLSIKDKQTVSFETTADKTLRDLVAVKVSEKCYINKLAIFYGANASGKSNILYALEAMFDILYRPMVDKTQMLRYEPFALSQGEPTEFEVVFYKEGVRYEYAVSYCGTHIISEKLMYSPNKGKALFYSREFTGADTQPRIEFGSTLKMLSKTRQTIVANTLNNHSVLSVFAKLSLTEDANAFAELHNWIRKYVHNINGDKYERFMVAEMDKICANNDKKRFYLEMLKKADFNITDFQIVDDNDGLSQETIANLMSSKMSDERKFAILHDVAFLNHSEDGDFSIPTRWQSEGTLRFMELMDYIYDMITDNHIYFLDELGNKLHHDLLSYYLSILLTNSDESQLLFTTHNALLMHEEFVRRDMVYLAEKDKDTASSEYTRVSDMGLHKNLSLFNAYSIGKLGAKPELGSVYLKMKSNC